MTVRVAHLSDLHIARPPDSDAESEITYFEAFITRALPAALAGGLLASLAHPRTREALLDLMAEARDKAEEIDWGKVALVLAGVGAVGAAVGFIYRRKLMQFFLSMRKDNHVVRDRLLRDLSTRRIDHLVISGDLTNVASPEEFRHARAFVDELSEATGGAGIALVPGNHDVQDSEPLDGKPDLGLFNQTFGDLIGPEPRFPHVGRVGPLCIVGLNSCTSGEGFGTRGRIGESQRSRLERALQGLDRGPKALVLHHHLRKRKLFEPGMPPLEDAAELLDLSRSHDVRIVFHGHQHTLYSDEEARLPLMCAGSTTLGSGGWRTRPEYRVFSFDDGGTLGEAPEVIELGE